LVTPTGDSAAEVAPLPLLRVYGFLSCVIARKLNLVQESNQITGYISTARSTRGKRYDVAARYFSCLVTQDWVINLVMMHATSVLNSIKRKGNNDGRGRGRTQTCALMTTVDSRNIS